MSEQVLEPLFIQIRSEFSRMFIKKNSTVSARRHLITQPQDPVEADWGWKGFIPGATKFNDWGWEGYIPHDKIQ
jgi:hypothetical protein